MACPCLPDYQGIHVARTTSVPSLGFFVGVQHIYSSWLASWFWCHPGVEKPIFGWLVHAYLTIRAFIWPEQHQFLAFRFIGRNVSRWNCQPVDLPWNLWTQQCRLWRGTLCIFQKQSFWYFVQTQGDCYIQIFVIHYYCLFLVCFFNFKRQS